MEDRNWAAHDHQLVNNPTGAQAEALGRNHAGYGWSAKPYGNWPDALKMLYFKGFGLSETEAAKRLNAEKGLR